MTIVPFLQMTGRYVSITGIPGFSNVRGQCGSAYGRYKDKVIDGKLRLWDEGNCLPTQAVADAAHEYAFELCRRAGAEVG